MMLNQNKEGRVDRKTKKYVHEYTYIYTYVGKRVSFMYDTQRTMVVYYTYNFMNILEGIETQVHSTIICEKWWNILQII